MRHEQVSLTGGAGLWSVSGRAGLDQERVLQPGGGCRDGGGHGQWRFCATFNGKAVLTL